MRRTLGSVSLALLLLVAVFGTSTVARQTRQDPDVLTALLVEVRGLRAAMEQLGTAGPRVQLAMGRLQLNEQRITTFIRRLDDVRDRRIPAEQELRTRQKQVADYMAAIQQARQPIDRETEENLTMLKAALADTNALVLRLQNEETRLTQDIATEQDRWVEINRILEDLDRTLTRK